MKHDIRCRYFYMRDSEIKWEHSCNIDNGHSSSSGKRFFFIFYFLREDSNHISYVGVRGEIITKLCIQSLILKVCYMCVISILNWLERDKIHVLAN